MSGHTADVRVKCTKCWQTVKYTYWVTETKQWLCENCIKELHANFKEEMNTRDTLIVTILHEFDDAKKNDESCIDYIELEVYESIMDKYDLSESMMRHLFSIWASSDSWD